jgi:hypothetical protein
VSDNEKHFLTRAELADRYAITQATVSNLVNRGLPSLKLGRARRFDPAACDAWLLDQMRALEVA